MPNEFRNRLLSVAMLVGAIALVVFAVRGNVQQMNERVARSPERLVGIEAPLIQLPAYGGGTFDLAAERGHVVVLDFWATWCPPCIESMPLTHAIVDRYADRGVKLVAISVDDSPERIKVAEGHLKLPPIVPLAEGTSVPTAYGISSIPTLVVIDAKGVVQAAGSMGVGDIEAWLPAAIDRALEASK